MVTWSYGGGVQSVAIAVLILQGRLPAPDIAIIADTGREIQSTWDYLDTVVHPALQKIGLEIVTASHEFSYVDLYKNDKLLIPAYARSATGEEMKSPTYCSNEWKKYVVRRCLRQMGVKETYLWLGISMDEIQRIKISDVAWTEHVYPLVDMIPMYRQQCVDLVESYGWPTPSKSRCFMCPNQGHAEWNDMRANHPKEFERAVQFEKEIHLTHPDMYLRRGLKPLEQTFKDGIVESNAEDFCDSGFCFV